MAREYYHELGAADIYGRHYLMIEKQLHATPGEISKVDEMTGYAATRSSEDAISRGRVKY